jgi:histidine ammonia-lyase
MTDHRNVRDIGWSINQSEFRAACLAMQRDDLDALKVALAQTYGFPAIAQREFNRLVDTTSGNLQFFLKGEKNE